MKLAKIPLKVNNLSNKFWVETIECVVYILNRSPTKSVKDRISQEAWNGMKHFVSHFRIFGCVSSTLVLAE